MGKIHQLAEEIDWKFCFEQGSGQNCHLYFQNEITESLEKEYGDVHTQIAEFEFVLLQLLEKEVMENSA